MATSEHKRRAKLAKKQAKDRQRHKELAQRQNVLSSTAGKMLTASGGEIAKCCVGDSLEGGMGTLIFARRAARGQLAFMVLLLDTYLLGVKNAFGVVDDASRLEAVVSRIEENEGVREISPAQARGLVEASMAYAKQFGFAPHPDYRKCEPLWGDVVAESVEGLFTFGQDGKPTYISGPNETPSQANSIAQRLATACGEGNYNCVIHNPAGLTLQSLEADDEDGAPFDDDDDDELT